MDRPTTGARGRHRKKLLIFLENNVPQMQEDFHNTLEEAERDGHDVGFIERNSAYFENGWAEMFTDEFYLWVGYLRGMIGMIAVGYTPFEGELTRLDWRAMAILKQHSEAG